MSENSSDSTDENNSGNSSERRLQEMEDYMLNLDANVTEEIQLIFEDQYRHRQYQEAAIKAHIVMKDVVLLNQTSLYVNISRFNKVTQKYQKSFRLNPFQIKKTDLQYSTRYVFRSEETNEYLFGNHKPTLMYKGPGKVIFIRRMNANDNPNKRDYFQYIDLEGLQDQEATTSTH